MKYSYLRGNNHLTGIRFTGKLNNTGDTRNNIGKISDLVLNMLIYSKEREPEYEACEPNGIVNDVYELVMDKAGENRVEIAIEPDDSIGEVIMDPGIIHEVLLNLASNAVDACLFDEDLSKHWIVKLKTAKVPGNIIKFDVSDNGAGMNEEVLQKLFTSFFSTKGHRGTGLGLMVTRKLIEEHNGKIEVTSRLNEGTTFTVQLPYRDPGEV